MFRKNAVKSTIKGRHRGPPKEYATQIALRLSATQLAAIAAVLADGEERATFIRSAIETEIRRRQTGR